MSGYVIYYGKRSHKDSFFANSGEWLLWGIMFFVMWYKFHALNIVVSPRHALTAETFFGNLGVLLCLTSPLLLLPPRVRSAALLLLNFLLSLLILTDVLYLRYYSDLFSVRNIGLSAQVDEVADSVIALLRLKDVLYFVDIPIFAGLSLFMTRCFDLPRLSFLRFCAVFALFAAGFSGVYWKMTHYGSAVSGALRAMWDRPAVAAGTGTLIYHVADVRNMIADARTKTKYTSADRDELMNWFDARNSGAPAATGAAAGKNLIIIQVESLQSFVVDMKLGGVEVTPNINRLTRESVYFTDTYNQTASGNSCDSEFMVNTSLYPASVGVSFVRFAGNRYHSLCSALKELGYSTIALHGDRPGFWNRNHMYPSLGFDRYISRNEMGASEMIGLGISDRDFFKKSLPYLKELRDGGKPFYSLLVTLTSHYPFNFGGIRESVTDMPLGSLEGTITGDYLLSIRYADRELGRFIEALDAEGLLDSSVLAVYGDHPAIPLSDAEPLGKLIGVKNLSSPVEWRRVQSIPIMIRLPGGEGARRVDAPTGQMDIAPTLASLMGFSIPTAFGRDLLDRSLVSRDKLVVFRNGSYIKGRAWVKPAEESAFDTATGEPLPYGDFMQSAAEVRKQLSANDMLLEGDLAHSITLPTLAKDEKREYGATGSKELN